MIELLIVLALIGLNGLFALSELAVVSARQPRLKAMANAGRRGAQRALALRSDPGRFLSSVQIGITLIGIVNGAFSGETFGEAAAEQLMALGVGKAVAGPLGFGLVIVVVTYLSIIVGELVPKSIALRNPDAVACLVAPSMTAFARFATPAVWLLDASTRLVFRLLGQSKANETRVTDEEIRMLIAEAETAGVLERGEREMIAGVMRLADRGVSGVMTPRTDVEWIDVAADVEEIRQRLTTTQHSRLPVGEGADRMIGVVQARELLAALLAGERLDIRTHTRVAPIIPETTDALDVLNVLRTSSVPVALVHDEYGHFMGLVTPADVLEVISGVFKSHAEDQQPLALQRDDGAWVLAGGLPVDEMAERLGIVVPAQRGYETVAGFALAHLQRVPAAGDHFITQDWRFDVTKLNGNRIGAVLATRFIGSRRTHSG